MTINFNISDRNGIPLNIGDEVKLYDWGSDHQFLGYAVIYFDLDEGRINVQPCLVEDAYDLITKALPRCEKS